jgi:hypothetical protein
MNFAVNYVPVLVAALVSFFIGFMWHGPIFGKQWIKLMKITPAEMKKGQEEMSKKMPMYLIAAYIQQVVTAYVIAVLAPVVGVTDTPSAVLFAFLLWLGLIATTLLNGVLWEKRTIPLYVFNIIYQLVSIIVITLIVGLWM